MKNGDIEILSIFQINESTNCELIDLKKILQ